jgi:ubiquinone/menaquinone biosynthesis C-methylase UbiE
MSGNSATGDFRDTDFLPAAGLHFLTPAYELLAWPMLAGVWRGVVDDVCQRAGQAASIVDLGCGPGTVLRRLARRRPDLSLTGVDIDERVLRITRRRVPRAKLLQGSADNLPVTDASADIVVSSMVFHHLPREIKLRALAEVNRILKPGSVFLLCDFARPTTRLGAWFVRSFAMLESGVGRQAAGELQELAASSAMALTPLWTRLGCITQHEVRAAS